ncbi:MAG: GTPase HflX, partial [Anaerolineae bacterium]
MSDYDAQNLIETQRPAERALLVGVELKGWQAGWDLEDSLMELGQLARTAGLDVVGQTWQRLDQYNPATLIGSGKVKELVDLRDDLGCNVVIFDEELSPRQLRNLEEALGEEVKILDRTSLILDIFAQHARTREGQLQVELAQYQYRLPRLTRAWTHLARQAGGGTARGGTGGVGLRGPGETQLEVDRRLISRRIAQIEGELEQVRRHRALHRRQRKRLDLPVVAIVGYTNAGKSTLLNALSGADVLVEDKLFATLDPTTRRVALPSGREILFSDTVGFIQKLPTQLIAAFRATLEEINEADLVVHVVDITHPQARDQSDAVVETLEAIGVVG